MINKILRNISNIPGWTTNRKIIVIESDDWGSIRMSSPDSFHKLKQSGIPVHKNHYTSNDALESNEDMEYLLELLTKYKDANNRNIVMTGLNIVANPDFDSIRKNHYQDYVYESFVETCSKYPKHDRVYKLWKTAIDQNLFVPSFHGREHLNIQRWMGELQKGCESTILAFNNCISGISIGVNGVKIPNYQAAFDIDTQESIKYQKEVITNGLDLFEKLFGFRSKFFVPPNGPFNNQLEKIAKNSGIKYIGTSKIHSEPLGQNKFKKHFRYVGKRSKDGLIYMTRNAFFEPCSFKNSKSKDWVDSCLNEIKIAFRWKKPAIISSHRVNYVGWLNEKNRTKGLRELDELLFQIIKYWPTAEFMTSSELGNLINETGS